MNEQAEVYFVLRFDVSNSDPAIAVDEDLKGVARNAPLATRRLGEWPPDVTFFAAGRIHEDYLFATLPGWVLISQRVQAVLRDLDPEGIELLPVQIERRDVGDALAHYAALHVLRELAAVDGAATRILARPEPGRPRIAQLALRRAVVRDADIFRLAEDPATIVVSPHVRQALDGLGATGFAWQPVPLV